ncbi:MAG: methyltransferase [Flavobacteriales bacterium]|jgi:hypothetical protein|nr:methyltransferase [Flavobacteriales bacterium]
MNKATEWRYKKTYSFLSKHCTKSDNILDLGTSNHLSQLIQEKGYNITNTKGENLDIEFESVLNDNIDIVTAFEIFEHMLAPFNILNKIRANRLIASVPLKLWFAESYWNNDNDWDKHYHEFEKKQFNFLLKNTGWNIIDTETWKPYPQFKFGIRPFLRMITPRYYVVYCERI